MVAGTFVEQPTMFVWSI